MSAIHALVFLAIVLCYPLFAIWSAGRFKWLSWISPVMQCYFFGVVLANLPLHVVQPGVSRGCMMASVPLAIPLLLFSTDFPGWMRLAKRTVISFVLAMVSTIIVAGIAAVSLSVPGEESWKVAGMMVGVYTGGTPNMSAIGWALKVEENTFVLVNAVDMFMGGIFFFFLITIAKPLLGRFMPPFPKSEEPRAESPQVEQTRTSSNRKKIKHTAIAFGLAVLVVLLSALVAVGLTLLFRPTLPFGQIFDDPVFNSGIMIAISTLAIAASFVPRIRHLEGAFEFGDYLILIFCVAVGSLANVRQLVDAGLPYFIYVGSVMFGAIILHMILATIFRIDVETAIITSTAAIYGPAFIGPVAGALKNRELLVSGITSAMVGIALGTQLGLALAYLMSGM